MILGKTKYSNRVFDSANIEIPMPEKCYRATVQFEEATWKRPRWFSKRIVRAQVDIPGGIPVPGKGENSWDIDEDAIYSICFSATKTWEVVGKVVESVMNSRIRHGGLKWRPEAKEATPCENISQS
jgi:hypothetical protein